MGSHPLGYIGNTVRFSPIIDSRIVVAGYNPNAFASRLNVFDPMFYSIYSLTTLYNINDCNWSSTNTNLIILAADQGSSHILDINRTEEFRQSFFRHNSSNTTSVEWHPKGGVMFLSSSCDGTVNLWSVDRSIPLNTYNHPTEVSCITWYPRNPTFYAYACSDGKLRVRDIRNGNAVTTIPGDGPPLNCCDWNPHGKVLIATGSHSRNHINLWDITMPNVPFKVLHGGHLGGVRRVKFSPHRRYQLASCSSDKRVTLWDYGQENAAPRTITYGHHGAIVKGLDMSTQVEGQVGSCGEDGLLRVWQYALPEA